MTSHKDLQDSTTNKLQVTSYKLESSTFSHLIDPSRFATTMFFAASRPIMTVNYSLNTEPHSFPPIMTVNDSLTTKLHS